MTDLLKLGMGIWFRFDLHLVLGSWTPSHPNPTCELQRDSKSVDRQTTGDKYTALWDTWIHCCQLVFFVFVFFVFTDKFWFVFFQSGVVFVAKAKKCVLPIPTRIEPQPHASPLETPPNYNQSCTKFSHLHTSVLSRLYSNSLSLAFPLLTPVCG